MVTSHRAQPKKRIFDTDSHSAVPCVQSDLIRRWQKSCQTQLLISIEKHFTQLELLCFRHEQRRNDDDGIAVQPPSPPSHAELFKAQMRFSATEPDRNNSDNKNAAKACRI